MIATLQYSSNAAGPYKVCGTLRSKDKFYIVHPIIQVNRIGNPERIGYKIEAKTKLLVLNSDFLSQTQWHFRLEFVDDSKMVYLGEYPYQINFDALLDQNIELIHEVSIQFRAYTSPQIIPYTHKLYISDIAIFI